MRKAAVILAILVSFGVGCQAAEDEVRQRAGDEVDRQSERLRERVDEEINERSTQVEDRVEEEVTGLMQGEEGQ